MRVAGGFLIALGLALTASAASTVPRTTLLTWGIDAKPANGDSGLATLSRGGRYVAFQSVATNVARSHKYDDGRFVVFASGDPNLVPGALPQWHPANAISQVFIRGPLH